MKKLLIIFLVLSFSPQLFAQPSADKMDWRKDAKFGMFIHWGVYSVPAGNYNGKEVKRSGEWIMNRGKIPVAGYKV